MFIQEKLDKIARKEVYKVNENETVGYLIRELNKWRLRRFPVENDDGHLTGIVSVSDILLSIFETGSEEFLKESISDIMTVDIIVAQAGDTVGQTIISMYNAGISGLPVVEDNKLIGMFTDKDILLLDKLWNETKDATVTASEGIGRPITEESVITDNFTFWQAADKLVHQASRQVIVKSDDGVLRGILTGMELASAVVKDIIIGDSTLSYLQTTKISTIPIRPLFQRSSPTVVSSLRMWMNSRAIEAFPLFQHNKPVKLITEKDLVGYLAMYVEEKLDQ
jgi:CBS domain-containing protein